MGNISVIMLGYEFFFTLLLFNAAKILKLCNICEISPKIATIYEKKLKIVSF